MVQEGAFGICGQVPEDCVKRMCRENMHLVLTLTLPLLIVTIGLDAHEKRVGIEGT